jgi:hypothetical protein
LFVHSSITSGKVKTKGQSRHVDDFYDWWIAQKISGSGVPEEVVPDNTWNEGNIFTTRGVPICYCWGRGKATNDLHVGAIALAGDCKRMWFMHAIPWLALILLSGVCANAYQVYSRLEIFQRFFSHVRDGHNVLKPHEYAQAIFLVVFLILTSVRGSFLHQFSEH